MALPLEPRGGDGGGDSSPGAAVAFVDSPSIEAKPSRPKSSCPFLGDAGTWTIGRVDLDPAEWYFVSDGADGFAEPPKPANEELAAEVDAAGDKEPNPAKGDLDSLEGDGEGFAPNPANDDFVSPAVGGAGLAPKPLKGDWPSLDGDDAGRDPKPANTGLFSLLAGAAALPNADDPKPEDFAAPKALCPEAVVPNVLSVAPSLSIPSFFSVGLAAFAPNALVPDEAANPNPPADALDPKAEVAEEPVVAPKADAPPAIAGLPKAVPILTDGLDA